MRVIRLRSPFHALGIVIVLAAVVAAACTSDDGGDGDQTDNEERASESIGPAPSEQASTSVEADYGEAVEARQAARNPRLVKSIVFAAAGE